MKILRTPEERFANIPDFPFEAKYIDIDGMRVHYVEEGNPDGEVILCLHGEPSWSYLYRKMIPTLASKHRVIAFDFIGFGKSDKYGEKSAYTYQLHYNTLSKFVDALQLKNITLVVQDWGGLIGLPYAMENDAKIARLVVMNTMLPSARTSSTWGKLGMIAKALPFFLWRAFSKIWPNMPVGRIIQMGTHSKLSDEVVAAYNAPFPSNAHKAGAAIWPSLVPLFANDPAAAYMRLAREKLKKWHKPAIVLFSDKDFILGGHRSFFQKRIPSAKLEPKIIIKDAGHFLQEEKGEEISQHILAFMERRG